MPPLALEFIDVDALAVLCGLYDFHHDSEAERKELSPDNARDMVGWVLHEWEERRKGTAERQAMRDQLATWCPGWERGVT